jgi:hypothetical protein
VKPPFPLTPASRTPAVALVPPVALEFEPALGLEQAEARAQSPPKVSLVRRHGRNDQTFMSSDS